MLTLFQSVILGALQGITEFLPISSSGHLVVVQQLFGWQAQNSMILAFDVALHVGTLLAVLIAFKKDVLDLLVGRRWRLFMLLILSTLPAVVFGVLLKDVIESLFGSTKTVGFEWLFTAVFLFLTRYASENPRSPDNVDKIPWPSSFIIGCAQAIAILPAVSRSGATIAAGLFLGLRRDVASRFAFLMAIPAIAGGAVLDAKEIMAFPREGLPQLIIGTLVSFIVGYLSIKWLLNIIQRGKFWWFAVYCLVVGVAAIVWQYGI